MYRTHTSENASNNLCMSCFSTAKLKSNFTFCTDTSLSMDTLGPNRVQVFFKLSVKFFLQFTLLHHRFTLQLKWVHLSMFIYLLCFSFLFTFMFISVPFSMLTPTSFATRRVVGHSTINCRVFSIYHKVTLSMDMIISFSYTFLYFIDID